MGYSLRPLKHVAASTSTIGDTMAEERRRVVDRSTAVEVTFSAVWAAFDNQVPDVGAGDDTRENGWDRSKSCRRIAIS